MDLNRAIEQGELLIQLRPKERIAIDRAVPPYGWPGPLDNEECWRVTIDLDLSPNGRIVVVEHHGDLTEAFETARQRMDSAYASY